MPKPTKEHRIPNRRLKVVSKVNTAPPATDPAPQKAEDKVLDALRGTDGATAAEIALAAGVGGSTARKVLAAFAQDGTAVRIATDGARTPDRWQLAEATGKKAPADGCPDDDNACPAAAKNPDGAAETPGPAPERAQPRWVQPAVAGRKPRLARGALRGLVEDFLRDHPDAGFTPGEIGRKLGHSPGAVANAAETLTRSSAVIRTADRPRTYQVARTTADGRSTATERT